ncbi:MAG: hypothetical protein KUG73_11385 [Pseudomonadales bacterium]|nr:hypothetical protein [Pseudomonadales bacterium]
MSRSKHPNKAIESALKHAEANGWAVEKAGNSAHAWGQMLCPTNNLCRGGNNCRASIWSTPRSPGNHARAIKSIVDKCEAQED